MSREDPSLTVPPVPASPRRELVAGTAIAAVFFGLFLGWSAFARLDASAYAPGQIAVSGNRFSVQHQSGGTVRSVQVAEGDLVRQGQVLVELTSGELRASERGVTGQILALIAQRARMIAEQAGQASISTPVEFYDLPPEDELLANEAMRLQRQQLAARRAGRSTERAVLGQRTGQLNEQIVGFERQIAANVEQRRLIEQELEGLRSLAERGFAPLNRVRALERTAAALDGEAGSLRAQVARVREAQGETRLQAVGITTRSNEEIADALRQIDVQLNDLRPRQSELRQQIERSQIRAPATGQVVALSVFNTGSVLQPGQSVMEIVPDRTDYVIVASINPSDIDDVKVGMLTEVRFPGLYDRSLPIVRGRVTVVAADALVDERTGLSHYRGEIVIPPSELEKLGTARPDIRVGVPVDVVINLRPRTVLEYLLEPLTRSLWRTGSAS